MGTILHLPTRQAPKPQHLPPRKATLAWQLQVHLAQPFKTNGEKQTRVSYNDTELRHLADTLALHLLRVRGRRSYAFPMPSTNSAEHPALVPPPTIVVLVTFTQAWLEPNRIDDLLDDKGYALGIFESDIAEHARLIPSAQLVAIEDEALHMANQRYPNLSQAMHTHGLPTVSLSMFS